MVSWLCLSAKEYKWEPVNCEDTKGNGMGGGEGVVGLGVGEGS